MKSKAISKNSSEWIINWLIIYFVFWIWGFLLTGASGGCPKVCECKWKGGKQYVSCSGAKFIDIPRGLEPSTQVLNLEHNNLKILFRDAFVDRGLVNLQKVYLTFCNLRKLEKGSFRKLANLVKLDVSNNFLTFLPDEPLSDVSDLRELSIRNNSLSYIPANAFKGTRELVHLDLGLNKIKTIEDRAFAYLSKLEVLDLSSNKLHTLAVQVLQPLDSLHGLYAHGNSWHCNCFLRPLRYWMIERNIASSIPPTCSRPERLKDHPWDSLELNEFVCVPHVTPVAPRVLASHGDNVSLACRVETDDDALVTWLIGDKAVAKGDHAVEPRYKVLELLVPNQGNASRVSNLTIAGADMHDQGIYRCVVENKAGRVETNLTLKVSEVISENPLVEIDQVFVAGALLGGLAFVIFAIFIACAVFYKRKRRHAQNIARMTDDVGEASSSAKLSDKPEGYKIEGHPGYAEYQIVPTSDNDNEYQDFQEDLKDAEPENSKTKRNEHYNRTGGDSSRSKIGIDIPGKSLNVGAADLAQPQLDFGVSKPSLGAEEPLLQNLAQQCKNEALKRQQHYREIGSVFSGSTNVRFPDLLTSQTSDFQYCTIPRGMRHQQRGTLSSSDNPSSDLREADETAETSFSSVLEPTPRSSAVSLPLKDNIHYRRTPSLPSTPLQTHIPPAWGKMLSADDSDDFSSLQPFDYEFHANQLEHFLQEYKSLQEELYRMKETAVEAPDEEKRAKITTRPSLDSESDWRSGGSTFGGGVIEGTLPSSSTAPSIHDNRSFSGGDSHLKSILKRKDHLHRHSLSRDFVFET